MRAILVWVVLLCVPAMAPAQTLSERLASLSPGEWLSYQVPLQPGQRPPCCFDWRVRDVRGVVCRLDREEWNFGHRDDDPMPPPGARLRVLVRKGSAGVDRVRALGEQCSIEPAGARVVEAGVVTSEQSLAVLAPLLEAERKDPHQALSAVAHHAGPAADAALLRAAAAGQRREQRRDALFWLAQARGAVGFDELRDQLRGEGDDELRRHLVFLLTVSPVPDARSELRRLGTAHADGDVRGEAMFWLSQAGDPQAEAIIREALREERSRAVLDKAVFALSQLPAGRAVPALRELLESDADRHVRKQALFWLAQVDDDAVLPLFDRLLGGGEAAGR